jgi:DNA-binding Lrp family transcriptional regulator
MGFVLLSSGVNRYAISLSEFSPPMKHYKGLISNLVGDDGMGNLTGDIANSIFRRTVSALKGQISMSGKMLELLMLLDGRTTLRVVSQKMNISMSDVRPYLSKLIEYGVIEEIQESIEILDPKILGYMAGQLSRITGPIAQVMVEDAVLDISGGSSDVPKNKAADLVEVLGRQIPDEKQRVEFIQNILQKLRDM